MSRYIEIIFDDSGSMDSFENGKPKHILAKEIFNENVLPQLGKKDDELVLRTLRNGCEGNSTFKIFSNKKILKENIDNISDFFKNTPLYLTIRDSIRACSASNKKEKFIFVLTDGDDNCSDSLDKILTKKELEEKDRINTKIILIQFAVTSKISQNNLTVLSQKLNAQNVIIPQNELKNINKIKSKLTAAFIESGIDKSSELPHCFEEIEDENDINSWDLLELLGEFDFYLAELLYQEKLLTWKPNYKKSISKTQFEELKFLYTLRFKNSLPESLVKQMLSNLKKPYKYSHDHIYWDFLLRKWRCHKKENEFNIIDNPDAKNDDKVFNEEIKDNSLNNKHKEVYEDHTLYVIKQNDTISPTFCIVKKDGDSFHVNSLREGDVIRFEP